MATNSYYHPMLSYSHLLRPPFATFKTRFTLSLNHGSQERNSVIVRHLRGVTFPLSGKTFNWLVRRFL